MKLSSTCRRTQLKKKRFIEEQTMWLFGGSEAPTIERAARHHGMVETFIYRWKEQFVRMEDHQCTEVTKTSEEGRPTEKFLAKRYLEGVMMKNWQATK